MRIPKQTEVTSGPRSDPGLPVFLLVDGPYEGCWTDDREVEHDADGDTRTDALRFTFFPDSLTCLGPVGSAVYDVKRKPDGQRYGSFSHFG